MSTGRAGKAISMRTSAAVIVVLGVLIALAFLLVHQANFLVGRSLLIAFGNDADSTYKGAWFDLGGNLVASNFELKPYGPEADARLTFEKVRVETPGWGWILRTLRTGKIVADTDRLHVTLEGGTSSGGVDPSLGDLGPFGTDTASPFEAEGCMQDSAWLRSELVEMGLAPGPTVLDFDYTVVGRKLGSRISLETPGVSKVILTRHENLPGTINPYLLDLTQTMTTDEHWQVEDLGFVKARNAFCAKRDGITEADFVVRHVQSVKRLMAIEGLALDQTSLATYSDFARNGGAIAFGGTYINPLPSDIYYEVRETGAALTRMYGTVERNGRKTAAQWSSITPRPLPGLDSMATFAAMQKESGYGGPTLTPSAIAPAAVGPGAGAVAELQPAAGPVQVAVPEPAPVAAAVTAPAPAQTAALAASAKPGDEIAWQDLSHYLNRDFEITTARMGSRDVVLIAASAGEITVAGSVQGGRVQNRIYRDGFSRAVLLR